MIQDQIDDLTGVARPVEVKVFGPDAATLRGLAAQIGEFVEKAGAKDVNTNVHLGNPDLIVRPRREAIARMGLNEQDIENQLNAALYGAGRHDAPAAGPHYRDPRALSGRGPLQSQSAGTASDRAARRQRPGKAALRLAYNAAAGLSSRSAKWRRSRSSGVPMRSGGRTSSR